MSPLPYIPIFISLVMACVEVFDNYRTYLNSNLLLIKLVIMTEKDAVDE